MRNDWVAVAFGITVLAIGFALAAVVVLAVMACAWLIEWGMP